MTIDDFTVIIEPDRIPYIPWHNIKKVMSPEMFKKWTWMSRNSTSYLEGAYKHDLERFLRYYAK